MHFTCAIGRFHERHSGLATWGHVGQGGDKRWSTRASVSISKMSFPRLVVYELTRQRPAFHVAGARAPGSLELRSAPARSANVRSSAQAGRRIVVKKSRAFKQCNCLFTGRVGISSKVWIRGTFVLDTRLQRRS